MGLGFAKGVREHLPNARKTIGKFHVVKHANEAVDKVGRTEARERPIPRNTKYVWLGNESNLTDPRPEVKRDLGGQRLKTARAGCANARRGIYACGAGRMEAEARLKALCSWMMRSRLGPVKALSRRFKRHRNDVLACFDHRCANAILEGLNGIIRHVKTRARGYGNMGHFSTMIYQTCGKLGLNTVTT